jgi:uncharacterized membrane protein YfcA
LSSIYLGARIDDKNDLRATVAATVLVNSSTRMVVFAAAGVLSADLLRTALFLVPSVLAGLYFGSRLHGAVPLVHIVRVILVLVLIAGVSLLARGLALQ